MVSSPYNTIHNRNPHYGYSARRSTSGILRSPSYGDLQSYDSRHSKRVTFADQVKLSRRNSMPARSHSDLNSEFGFRQYDDRDHRRSSSRNNSNSSSISNSSSRRKSKDDDRRRKKDSKKREEKQRKKYYDDKKRSKRDNENDSYYANYGRQSTYVPYAMHYAHNPYAAYYAHDMYRHRRMI